MLIQRVTYKQSYFQNLKKEKIEALEDRIIQKEMLITGNDGLTKQFYEKFLSEEKIPVQLAIEKAYFVKQLLVS